MTKKIISTPLQFAQLSAGEDGDQWKVSGYATVFDNKNCYGFKIAQGAYAELIKKGVQPHFLQSSKLLCVDREVDNTKRRQDWSLC